MGENIAASIKTTILELIVDARKNIFTNADDQGDMMLVEFFFTKLAPKSVADKTVMYILPYSKEIDARNIEFFIKTKSIIFAGLPSHRVDYFAGLIQDEKISSEDQEILWSYIDTIKELTIAYKKNK